MFENKLKIGDITVKFPIIQGGMGVGISLAGLAAAVANAGGVGVIATAGIAMYESDKKTDFVESNNRALKQEIRKARSLIKGDGVLGVNIMVGLTNYADLLETSISEGIDVIFSGAGLPFDLPKFCRTKKTKLVPIVSSARAAKIICRKWIEKYSYTPDAIVLEGPRAGGHLGFRKEHISDPKYSLDNLVLETLAVLKEFENKTTKKIPLIAAGGIYSKDDIIKFLKLGASGVQMATRFVATNECDASLEFKNQYVNCSSEDIIIIESPLGLPGRAIRNEFIDQVNRGEQKPFSCPYHCLITCKKQKAPYCIAEALAGAKEGHFDRGFAFSGDNAYRIEKIISVKELFKELGFRNERTNLCS